MSSIGEIYRKTVFMFREAGIGEAEAEAKVLLAHVQGCGLSQLCLRFFDECKSIPEIEKAAAKRIKGIPLAYILGEKDFYGRAFTVDDRVLIPRFDTESVVFRALELIRQNGYRTALDLCCGSGAIGITLCVEGKLERVDFADASDGALCVTEINCRKYLPHGIYNLKQGDLFEPVTGTYDMIVSNPPYISASDFEELEPLVREQEPKMALLAEEEGYAFYRRIASQAGKYLKPNGALVLEIGDMQAEKVCKLLWNAGFVEVESGCDLAGRPRWVSAYPAVGAR